MELSHSTVHVVDGVCVCAVLWAHLSAKQCTPHTHSSLTSALLYNGTIDIIALLHVYLGPHCTYICMYYYYSCH